MLIIIKCVSTQVQPPSIPLSIIIVTIFIAITIFCRYQYFHSENNFAGGGDVVNFHFSLLLLLVPLPV